MKLGCIGAASEEGISGFEAILKVQGGEVRSAFDCWVEIHAPSRPPRYSEGLLILAGVSGHEK